MKRVALLLFLAGWLVPLAKAQDQFQVGAYGDYFRVSQTSTNMAGLGGRVGYKIFPYMMFEGEVSYDFEQGFIEHCTSVSCLGLVANSNLKVLHGLAGVKFIGSRHAIRPFVTVKAGFINFQLNPKPATFGGFTSSIQNLRSNNVSAVLYPALGAEGHLGPLGLRLEAGDEMYFAGAAHHNVRVAFGPFFRF
ncbi:MAG TPA: hypothetical protein VHM93_19045 [Candidatus Acidoferrum sp.]|jgi:hypothetical protein|nr:hypothetical protein [Candidatus Acidoferrum sp.]